MQSLWAVFVVLTACVGSQAYVGGEMRCEKLAVSSHVFVACSGSQACFHVGGRAVMLWENPPTCCLAFLGSQTCSLGGDVRRLAATASLADPGC